MKSLLRMAPLFLFTMSTLGQSQIASGIGTVKSKSGNEACLAIQNAQLKSGQKISIVFPEKPQTISTAAVTEKMASACSSDISTKDASYYLLKLQKQDPFVAIGVVTAKKIYIAKGVASVDLDNDQNNEYFRVCASNEGIHLTVWTGKPLLGKRIWHTYYHLNYDTDPTCKEKDYEGTDE